MPINEQKVDATNCNNSVCISIPHLLIAADSGNKTSVELELEAGADPNCSDIYHMTSLMRLALKSANEENDEIAKLLLKFKANPNLSDINGNTALFMATDRANDSYLKILLDGGGNPNSINNNFYSPLMMAAQIGSITKMKLLLDTGAKVNFMTHLGSALSVASAKGNIESVKLLIGRGADLDGILPPLLVASANNHVDVVKELLRNGANPNPDNIIKGKSVLDIIQSFGNQEINAAIGEKMTLSEEEYYLKYHTDNWEGGGLAGDTILESI